MGVADSFFEERKSVDTRILAQGGDLQGELNAKADQKLAGFTELKSEVDSRLTTARDTLEDVRQLIRDNIFDKKTGDGWIPEVG